MPWIGKERAADGDLWSQTLVGRKVLPLGTADQSGLVRSGARVAGSSFTFTLSVNRAYRHELVSLYDTPSYSGNEKSIEGCSMYNSYRLSTPRRHIIHI